MSVQDDVEAAQLVIDGWVHIPKEDRWLLGRLPPGTTGTEMIIRDACTSATRATAFASSRSEAANKRHWLNSFAKKRPDCIKVVSTNVFRAFLVRGGTSTGVKEWTVIGSAPIGTGSSLSGTFSRKQLKT